jgi:hypothetical protein
MLALSQRSRLALPLLAAGVLIGVVGQAPAQASGEAPTYLQRLQARTKAWRGALPELRATATSAAKGVIAGGHLYITGPQQSFISEVLGRSGGLLLPQGYSPEVKLEANDTVLAAFAGAPGTLPKELSDLVTKASAARARVVLFASTDANALQTAPGVAPNTLFALPKKAFRDSARPSGLSIESVSNVVGMWAWTGEFVAAAAAQGKMPAFYESIGMPGGRERDNALSGVRFHPVTNVTPTAASGAGSRYLDALSTALSKTIKENSSQFTQAGTLLRASRAAGGVVKTYYLGHMFPMEITVPQNPASFTTATQIPLPAGMVPGLVEAAPTNILGPNDIGLILGYQAFPSVVVDSAPNGTWIVTSSHRALGEYTSNPKHVYLNPFWDTQDAVVRVEGYDIDILPISGVMQSAIYWQLVELSGGKTGP